VEGTPNAGKDGQDGAAAVDTPLAVKLTPDEPTPRAVVVTLAGTLTLVPGTDNDNVADVG